jgi:hypothetical protein
MFTKEMLDLLIQVVSSWQVLAVTVVFILYVFLVSYVARLHRQPRVSKSGFKKGKGKPSAGEPEEAGTTNEELGLEEG